MIWFLEDVGRHRAERLAIDQLASNSGWLTLLDWKIDTSARMTLEAVIMAGGRLFEVTLVFPSHFPHSPPFILPTNETDERWSGHQWGVGGELCLEWGPDNWQPGITGAMMLASAHKLLSGEREKDSRGEVPTRHKMSLGQDLRSEKLRFLASSEFLAAACALPRGVYSGQLLVTWRNATFIYHPLGLDGGALPEVFPLPATLVADFTERPFVLIRDPNDKAVLSASSYSELAGAIQETGGSLTDDVKYVVVSSNQTLRVFLVNTEEDIASSIAVLKVPDARPRLDPRYEELENKKLAVVGCGSLGSKVALSLARAGIGKFLLVDDDILLAENLVRHDLDLADVGRHKVDGVARRIELVSPADVTVRRHKLGGQESNGSVESLVEGLAECDLILDCTSDAKAFNYLSAAASVGKKPLISGEIFAGGIGGRMFRSRPDHDPSPADCRAAIDAWCYQQGKVIASSKVRYGQEEEEGPPLVASDSDVTIMAGHLARFAIDCLLAGESKYPFSAYIIGFEEGWLFDAPFETWPIDLGRPSLDTAAEPLPRDVAMEEFEVIRQLFAKLAPDAPANT